MYFTFTLHCLQQLQNDVQLCIDGFLLHDFHDGSTGAGASLWGGVNGDGLLSCTGVLLPVYVNPTNQKKKHD